MSGWPDYLWATRNPTPPPPPPPARKAFLAILISLLEFPGRRKDASGTDCNHINPVEPDLIEIPEEQRTE